MILRKAMIVSLTLLTFMTQTLAQTMMPKTSNDWLALVIALRAREALLDKDDKQFLFRMTNILTATDDAVPDAAQRKWILDIERRVMGK